MGIVLLILIAALMLLGSAVGQESMVTSEDSGSNLPAAKLEVGSYIGQKQGTAPAYVAGNTDFLSGSANFISEVALGNITVVFLITLAVIGLIGTFIVSKFKNRNKKLKRVLRFYLVVILFCSIFAVMPMNASASAVDTTDLDENDWDYAYPIDITTAKQMAVEHMNNMFPQLQSEIKRDFGISDITEVYTETKDGINLCYTINFDPQGWVIVSANYVAEPIIAYSITGYNYPEYRPEAVQKWMENVKDDIYYAIESVELSKPPSDIDTLEELESAIQDDEFSLSSTFPSKVPKLLTTEWGQGGKSNYWVPTMWWTPTYDRYLPKEKNWLGLYRVPPTGCVSTATAQVMNYWEWPPVGKGSHKYDPPSSKYDELEVDFSKRHYNWDDMANTAYGSLDFLKLFPIYGVKEPAKLMRDIGVAVEMDYGLGGSEASTSDVPTVLSTYFRYKATASYVAREGLTDAEWKTKLKTELSAGRPMLYRGEKSGASTGHVFICDGYDTSDKFHFNWGWDGKYDGYYSINDLTPGIWPDVSNFNTDNKAVIGIEPDFSGLMDVWVDDDYKKGSSGGHDWGYNAFNSIQKGIDMVLKGGTVHVNPGTYKENLTLKDNIFILSTGNSSNTIIDGQSNGSVIYAKNVGSTTVLDGFTIQNGSGSVYWGTVKGGGGIYFWDVNFPRISNCKIINNSADKGGGVFNYNSSPHFLNCTFESNTAKGAYPKGIGGGMYNYGASAPVIENCRFRYNKADTSAGGLYTGGSTTTSTIIKSDFYRNSAVDEGAALYIANSNSSDITDCTFRYNFSIGSTDYRDGKGGAIWNDSNSTPVYTNCKIYYNTAKYAGGAVANYGSKAKFINCEIFRNSSDLYGGAFYNYGSADPIITNTLMFKNSAKTTYSSYGGAMYNYGSGTNPVVTNSILWDNVPSEIYDSTSSSTTVNYSDIEGGHAGTDNINADPKFLYPTDYVFNLRPGSPCINAGSNSAPGIAEFDPDNHQRILYGTSDIGVYEYVNKLPVVDPNGPYTADEGTPITFDASGSSDPDGDTLQYRWDFDDDGTWDTSYSTDPTADYTWYDNHSGSVAVEVFDGLEVDTATTTVTVNNVAPTADLINDGPMDEGSPATVSFVNIVDPGTLDTFVYSFDWDNDGTYEIVDQSNSSAQFTWFDNGVFTVGASIMDDDGALSEYTTDVFVNNVSPSVDAGTDKMGFEPSPFTFIGSHTDPGTLDTHTYEWDFDYDGFTFDIDAEGNGASNTWLDDFVGSVALRVTDDDGDWNIDTCTVEVFNVAPTVSIDGYVQPFEDFILPTDVLEFTGSFTDPGVLDTHTIEWNFGDSTITTGTLVPTHAYSAPGIYTVTLTVTDDDGDVDTDSIVIVVLNNEEATGEVIDTVEELDLPKGTEDSCTSKLDNAIKSIEKGKENAAINQLDAFINHIEAQRGKKLTDEEADECIAAAQWIIDNLEEK
jgi:hypothetical protein